MDTDDQPAYLKPPEIAARLRVSLRTVHRLIDSGTLPAVKFGRVKRVPITAVHELERIKQWD